ncbi:hypothetical protein XELAEV_18019724mg [Xenopus laevis]|uniref:Uncharacterized protein n=1 Tax=Xenopus laevis TaxID=8355 RepID=A0A974HQ12_XENLA|nr:hypothetical protein XELAEV_18019724mg [Xenopus laevis]
MTFQQEDGVSLCHKALQIVSDLCLGGRVEWDKCSGIFPRTNQGAASAGNGGLTLFLSRLPHTLTGTYLLLPTHSWGA